MMEAIILAGGFGKRLRSVVSDVPKPMADIGGKPFLAYLVDYIAERGVNRILLSVGYMHKKIMAYFGGNGSNYKGAKIEYVVEKEPLGTGGAITLAMRQTNGQDVLILNGDTFFAIEPSALIKLHKSKGALLTMALKPVEDTGRYGSVIVDGERVVGFKEKAEGGVGLINAGVYVLNRQLLDFFEKYGEKFSFEVDFLPQNIFKLKVIAFVSDSYFIDIGVPDDYERAKKEFRAFLKGELA